MKKTLTIAALATASSTVAALAAAAMFTLATSGMTQADETYAATGTTLGVPPAHIQGYLQPVVAGTIAKGAYGTNSLDPKVRSLIGVAVAAQISCEDCLVVETKAAKARGATDAEVAEAVIRAASVRLRSIVLNGSQTDLGATPPASYLPYLGGFGDPLGITLTGTGAFAEFQD